MANFSALALNCGRKLLTKPLPVVASNAINQFHTSQADRLHRNSEGR